ncbi:MAG: hypothetical protein ACLPX9_02715 [Rhodomicrobium sp.]
MTDRFRNFSVTNVAGLFVAIGALYLTYISIPQPLAPKEPAPHRERLKHPSKESFLGPASSLLRVHPSTQPKRKILTADPRIVCKPDAKRLGNRVLPFRAMPAQGKNAIGDAVNNAESLEILDPAPANVYWVYVRRLRNGASGYVGRCFLLCNDAMISEGCIGDSQSSATIK